MGRCWENGRASASLVIKQKLKWEVWGVAKPLSLKEQQAWGCSVSANEAWGWRVLLWHFLVGTCDGNQIALRVRILKDPCPGPQDGWEGNPARGTWIWGMSASSLVHVTSLHAFCFQHLYYSCLWPHIDGRGDSKFEFKSEFSSSSVSYVWQWANHLTALQLHVLICEMGKQWYWTHRFVRTMKKIDHDAPSSS